MIRIYHFMLDHRIGGPHVYAKTVSLALKDKVHSFFVTSGNGESTDIALINLRHFLRLLYPFEILLNIIKLIFLFRNRDPDINYIFNIHGAANIAPVFASRILGIPYVWHFHETLSGLKGISLLGRIGESGNKHRYVVVAKKAIGVYGLADAVVLPGSVDTDFWARPKLKSTLNIHRRPLRLLTVGNLNPLKGHDLLFDSLSKYDETWELNHVGLFLSTHRKYQALLQDRVKSFSPLGTVQFKGWQSAENLHKLLLYTDIFILPSRSEACPIALLEAMSMGCICIATNVGDVDEIIDDSVSGFVVASNCPKSLLAAIKKVTNMSLSERKKMSENAQKKIILNYSHKRIAKQHLELYLSLC